MAKYKRYDYSQTVLLPVSLEEQLMPGTLEFALHTLVETRMDMSQFAERYSNDETGRSAYDPQLLVKIGLLAYAPSSKARLLAQALAELQGRHWQLTVAGGGPVQGEVRAAFAWDVEDRVRFLGEQSEAQVGALMRSCDLLAWPGCREAYGMVYLEAAAHGKPAAALRTHGVPLVVAHGVGGLLADPPDAAGYRRVLDTLIGDAALRARLGAGARQLLLERHSAVRAAALLREAIDPVLR